MIQSGTVRCATWFVFLEERHHCANRDKKWKKGRFKRTRRWNAPQQFEKSYYSILLIRISYYSSFLYSLSFYHTKLSPPRFFFLGTPRLTAAKVCLLTIIDTERKFSPSRLLPRKKFLSLSPLLTLHTRSWDLRVFWLERIERESHAK